MNAAPLAFAHRGGAGHPELAGRENTVAAFEHARALGYRCLETDVHVTRDGVLVVFHDADTQRLTGVPGPLADLTLAQVRALSVGGLAVPTLAELVEAVPDAFFNIDLKSDRAAAALPAFLDERGLTAQVLVGSFSPQRLRRFRRLTAGRVATSADIAEAAAFVLSTRLLGAAGVAYARRRPYVALQVPVERDGVVIVTPRFVRRAHEAGKQVHVWTVDEPEEMTRLIDLGVDGLMTDRTDLLRAVLLERGQWPSPTPGPFPPRVSGPQEIR